MHYATHTHTQHTVVIITNFHPLMRPEISYMTRLISDQLISVLILVWP